MSTEQHEPDDKAFLDALDEGRRFFESKRYAEALNCYLTIADSAYGRGILLRLGWMYEFGMGTTKDLNKAEYWYDRAAKAGLTEGYYCLGSMRLRAGRLGEVARYMERAAAVGYSPALFQLGQMYRFGKGVERDEGKAYAYYAQAAMQGHLFARRALAQRMLRGDLGLFRIPLGIFAVAKNMIDAFRLYMNNPSDPRLKRLA